MEMQPFIHFNIKFRSKQTQRQTCKDALGSPDAS